MEKSDQELWDETFAQLNLKKPYRELEGNARQDFDLLFLMKAEARDRRRKLEPLDICSFMSDASRKQFNFRR